MAPSMIMCAVSRTTPRFAPKAVAPLASRQTRSYAEKEDHSTSGSTSGGSNVRRSLATDPESASINANRATEDVKTPDNAAASRHPTSQSTHANLADEETEGHSNVKRPPEEPDHIKRQFVEKEGQKPLDPADK